MKFTAFGVACAALAFVHAAPIAHDEIESNVANGLRLLSLEDGAEPVWKTEDEKLDLLRAKKQFFDVTEVYEYDQERSTKASAKKAAAAFPTISHSSAVTPLLAKMSTANMQADLNTLSAFNNRYYTTSTGEQASTWILNTVSKLAKNGATVALFDHSWAQSSIIAKIPGSKASTPVTIIGAHMDSINLNNPTTGRAPGMDDDGTGTVNLIEAFRVLMANGFTPSTPVEFHWYSGEEAGLLGSQAVAKSYDSKNVDIRAFMEFDMTGYFKKGSTEVFALEADYIDAGLNTWLTSLIKTYSKVPVTMDTPCGYACSDHASWYKYGYPTAMPFEAVTGNDDPNIHSANDLTSVTGFSWSHSLEFAKIALAYVYEMAI